MSLFSRLLNPNPFSKTSFANPVNSGSPSKMVVRAIQGKDPTLASGPVTGRSLIDEGNQFGMNPPRIQQPSYNGGGFSGNQYFQNALIRALQGQGGQQGGQPMSGGPNYGNYVPPGGGQPPPSALPSSPNPAWQMGGQGQMNQLFQLGAAQPPQPPGINQNTRMGNLQPLGGSYA